MSLLPQKLGRGKLAYGWERWELLEPQARQGSTVHARSALGGEPQQALVQSLLLPRMIRNIRYRPGILEPATSGA